MAVPAGVEINAEGFVWRVPTGRRSALRLIVLCGLAALPPVVFGTLSLASGAGLEDVAGAAFGPGMIALFVLMVLMAMDRLAPMIPLELRLMGRQLQIQDVGWVRPDDVSLTQDGLVCGSEVLPVRVSEAEVLWFEARMAELREDQHEGSVPEEMRALVE